MTDDVIIGAIVVATVASPVVAWFLVSLVYRFRRPATVRLPLATIRHLPFKPRFDPLRRRAPSVPSADVECTADTPGRSVSPKGRP